MPGRALHDTGPPTADPSAVRHRAVSRATTPHGPPGAGPETDHRAPAGVPAHDRGGTTPGCRPDGAARLLTPSGAFGLQRSAGNRVVGLALASVQRDGPSVRERLTALEARETATRQRQAALQLDVRWRSVFGERLASYNTAIYRLSRGISIATSGFQTAQSAQAATDAMKTQVLGLLISVGAAVLFEPLFVMGLGALGARFSRLNLTTDRIKSLTERVENPAIAAVSGVATNIRGAQTAAASAERGQVPAVPANQAPGVASTPARVTLGPDAFGFLTANLEALSGHQQSMEAAFVRRSTALAACSDADMANFDVAGTEAEYSAILAGMNQVAAGAERLRSAEEIGAIYERFMWAAWIQGESDLGARITKMRRDMARAQGGVGPSAPEPGDAHQYSIGTDVEVRLRDVGVATRAGVELTGHWWSSNSPGNWQELLLSWSRGYRESIAVD